MKIEFRPVQPGACRKYTQWAMLVTALALLLTAVAFAVRDSARDAVHTDVSVNSPVYYSSNEMASQGNASEGAANSRNIKNSDTFYTIRAYDGTVAIFRSGDPAPVYTIDTPLSRLTEADRTLLAAGIRVETLAEAHRGLRMTRRAGGIPDCKAPDMPQGIRKGRPFPGAPPRRGFYFMLSS